MKLKEGYILREVAGNFMVIPVGGDNRHLNKVINLNETGAFLWEKLGQDQTAEALADAMCREYDIAQEIALSDVRDFLSLLQNNGFLCEE